MGYTTEFRGQFDLDKPLAPNHMAYLIAFAETRRMRRDPTVLEEYEDPVRECVDLPIGKEGEYFVGGRGEFGQGKDSSVLNYNVEPITQPGLWCHWVPNEDGTAIEWDGGEKFYGYTNWLSYIIHNFLKPWGYTLNGCVEWRGEEWEDYGTLVVENNKVCESFGRVTDGS